MSHPVHRRLHADGIIFIHKLTAQVTLGEHTDELLGEAGYAPAEIERANSRRLTNTR